MIANNSFIMAEYGGNGWTHVCLPEAVGVTDVTDPYLHFGCPGAPLYNPGFVDPNQNFRGLGRPCIINNLFRTRPDTSTQYFGTAMLGIDATDCRVRSTGVPFQDTNAFAIGRATAANQNFTSTPVVTQVPALIGTVYLTPSLSFPAPIYNCATRHMGNTFDRAHG